MAAATVGGGYSEGYETLESVDVKGATGEDTVDSAAVAAGATADDSNEDTELESMTVDGDSDEHV